MFAARNRIVEKTILGALCLSSFVCAPAYSLDLDFPVYDYPYNQEDSYRAPSMNQSLQLTKNMYRSVHAYIDNKFQNRASATITALGFDILATWLPFGDAWIHEEWHRAVMGRRGIDSYNEVYDFNIFSETIAVSDVRDEDLIFLKANHPAEIVRLHAAGMEAQTELNYSLERDHFFKQKNRFDLPVLWLSYLNNIGYMATCASNDSNTLTAEFYLREDQDISKRDFTGLDCNAWVYDLFRPTEPYTARGVHPSGSGVARYITYNDLTAAERSYLRRNVALSLLNLINPFLFGKNEFGTASRVWNITLRHHLTSFGYNLGINLFFKNKNHKFILSGQYYRNRATGFPGVELRWLNPNFALPIDQLRLAVWSQPDDQSFYTNKGKLGGLFALRSGKRIRKDLRIYAEFSTKTAGWLAGNVYLDAQWGITGGIEWQVWQ